MSLSDEELHQVVQHLATLNGVPASEVVAEVLGEEPDADGQEAASDTSPEPKKRSWAHWVAWSSAMMVMGVMVGGVIVVLLKLVNGPAEASIPKPKISLTSATPTPDQSISQLVGQTFSFNYPHIFDQVAGMKNDSGSIEQFNIGSKSNYRRLIAVDVRREQIATLSDDASYKIRQLHPEDYKETVYKTAAGSVDVMAKLDKREQTLFWLRDGKLLMVSVTSTDATDDVAAFMKVIIDSVRWTS